MLKSSGLIHTLMRSILSLWVICPTTYPTFFMFVFFGDISVIWTQMFINCLFALIFVVNFWFKIFLYEESTSRRAVWTDAMLICLHNTCLPLWLASERKHYLSFPIFSNIIFFYFLSCLRLAHVLPLSWSLVFLQESDLRGMQWVWIARWFTGLRSERDAVKWSNQVFFNPLFYILVLMPCCLRH